MPPVLQLTAPAGNHRHADREHNGVHHCQVVEQKHPPLSQRLRILPGQVGPEPQELGGQQAAHRWLADVCKVPVDQPLLTPPSEDEWWEKSLKTWFGLDVDALLGRETPAFLYSF